MDIEVVLQLFISFQNNVETSPKPSAILDFDKSYFFGFFVHPLGS